MKYHLFSSTPSPPSPLPLTLFSVLSVPLLPPPLVKELLCTIPSLCIRMWSGLVTMVAWTGRGLEARLSSSRERHWRDWGERVSGLVRGEEGEVRTGRRRIIGWSCFTHVSPAMMGWCILHWGLGGLPSVLLLLLPLMLQSFGQIPQCTAFILLFLLMRIEKLSAILLLILLLLLRWAGRPLLLLSSSYCLLLFPLPASPQAWVYI